MLEIEMKLSFLYRMVLREIKKKGIYNILVDTDSHNMNYFFRLFHLQFSIMILAITLNLFYRVILQLQMNNNKYHYLFTSFDVET